LYRDLAEKENGKGKFNSVYKQVKYKSKLALIAAIFND
jgi:hypothetical protein